MVRIRLRRMGKKKQPFYRIVAIDSRNRRDGKYIEKIGYYNPIHTEEQLVIDQEKALKWLKIGAIPSDTVKSFLRRKGIILRFDLMKKGYDEARIEEEMKKWELLQLERQRRLEARRAQLSREKGDVPDQEPAPEVEAPAPEAEVQAN